MEDKLLPNAEMISIYEAVLQNIESRILGASGVERVRNAVAAALLALSETGQRDRELLHRYAEYQGWMVARGASRGN